MLSITTLLSVYVHDLQPYAFWVVRWYGLSYLFGFFLGYLLVRRVAKVGVSTLNPAEVSDLVVTLALGICLGGRLGYCLFYEPSLLWSFDDRVPFWGVLAIQRGGMASHGGMIGGIIASWWYARRHKHAWAHVLDLLAFGAPLGLFFGRIANFINGELFGRPVEAGSIAMRWAVKFPQEMYRWNPEVPAENALIGKVREASQFLPELKDGKYFETWGQHVTAIIHAIQNGNREVTRIVAPVLTARHPSQLYEALMEGLLVAVVLMIVWARPRRPLVVCGMFCFLYGTVRIVGEQFREPDAHIVNLEFAHWGVTRGQLLSIPLALLGLGLIIYSRRVSHATGADERGRMGGWLKRPTA